MLSTTCKLKAIYSCCPYWSIFVVTWTPARGRGCILYQHLYQYVHSVGSYWHFTKFSIDAVHHFGFVGKSRDHPRRPIYGCFPCKNVVMIVLVVFKLQVSEFFVYHAWKSFSCPQNIRFWGMWLLKLWETLFAHPTPKRLNRGRN